MKSKYSAQQITEMEEVKQKDTRKSGFALMSTRDKGITTLSNGVVVKWHGKDFENGSGATEHTVPAGTFMINNILYDAEELRHWLRWA